MEGLLVEWQPVVVASAMMALDVVTGFAGAAKSKAVASGKMREGLWHKAGFFGLILLAFAYETAAALVNIEAGSAGLGVAVPELPAVSGACVFVVATEAVSVCENLCVLNPEIARLPGIRAIKRHGGGADSDGGQGKGRE
ncbi:hypothetical protein GMI70_02795 [Eggerthellaceae bacterium zg-893]|nr:hypothetical protein [Eggerthellaceae bacterium zg-893]